MSVLLVGCGYWGRNWARTLAAMKELGGICEASPAIQAGLKEQYPGVPVVSDLSEALELPGLEAVVVATPVVTHREVTRQCLLAGLSVLVEKPLALCPDEAQELATLADGGGRVLAVGHLLLYHPALLRLKALMDEGVLGEILAVQCTRVNLGKVRNEENAWWSLAPHDLSIISMLLNQEPLSVTQAVRLNVLGRPGLEDTVYAGFQTSAGCQASVHVSWLSPVKRHETVVLGTQGMAVFEDTLPTERKLQVIPYDLCRQGGQVLGVQRGEPRVEAYLDASVDLLTLEAQAFLEAARGQRPYLPNDGDNGVAVVRLLSEVQARLDAQAPCAGFSR